MEAEVIHIPGGISGYNNVGSQAACSLKRGRFYEVDILFAKNL